MWTGEIRQWYILHGTLNGQIYNSKGRFARPSWDYPDGTFISVEVYHYPDPGRLKNVSYLTPKGEDFPAETLSNWLRLTAGKEWHWDLQQVGDWVPCPLKFKFLVTEEITKSKRKFNLKDITTHRWWDYLYSEKEKNKFPFKHKRHELLDWGCVVSESPYGPKYWWHNWFDYRDKAKSKAIFLTKEQLLNKIKLPYKVIKEDGMSSTVKGFRNYNEALNYSRTDDIQQANCHYVVYEVYLVNKLVYTISARKKSLMELVPKEDDEEVTDPAPRPKLKMISGGMDGFHKDNWLQGLPEGTVFQCIRKGGAEFVAMQFHVRMKWKKTCHLFSNFPVQQTGDIIAHYVNFSSKHELCEVQRFGSDWIKENDDVGRRNEGSEDKE